MVGRHAIGTEQCEVFDVRRSLYLLAITAIGKSYQLPAVAGHAKTQCEWLSGSGTAVTFGAGKFAAPGLNSQVPCAPDFSASPVWAGVKSR